MPQLKQVETLSEACIINVIKHMNAYWVTKSKIKDLVDNATNMLYLVGPFDILNESIIHRIIKKLEENGELNRYNLFMLMHSRLAKIDFTALKNKSIINIPRLFEFIGTNCHNVTEVDLSTLVNLNPTMMISVLKCLRKLRKINLSHTKADADVVSKLATCFRHLQEVYLDNCTYIYDDSIYMLTSHLSNRLTKLSVENVEFSDECVRYILIHCTMLKLLRVENLIGNINYLMHDESQRFLYKFELEELYYVSNSIYLDNEQMASVSYSCPNLKRLTLACLGCNDILKFLNNFDYLNHLTLSNGHVILFKFTTHLYNFLTLQGIKLNALTLINIKDVNIHVIAKYCHNLAKLKIEVSNEFFYHPAKDEDHFPDIDPSTGEYNYSIFKEMKRLQYFSFVNNNAALKIKSDPTLDVNNLRFILDFKLVTKLSSGSLKFLNLETIYCLDSVSLMSLYDQMLSPNCVEEMQLINMSNLTYDFVFFLLRTFACLKKLSLIHCDLISRRDYINLLKYIKIKNFDLLVLWK